MKNKLLFIAPHLSTGGLPQYLLKKIENFIDQYDIWCIEWENLSGWAFVVQKNKIHSLLGEKHITLSQNKEQIINILNEVKPDIVHIEEIPETFISPNILDKIYDNSRSWNIVVTTHSSNTDFNSLKWTADKFILVSKWSRQQFLRSDIGEIPSDIWEYPIENKIADKETAQKQLGLDPTYKHVINVGLFTSGKNQGELFELARTLEYTHKIQFHFIGNQAGNFEDYWGPIMKNVPSNCKVWGERSDTDTFYAAADAFYFTSNFELNPLVLKEALSWGLKTWAKKLHTYLDSYDGLVNWILPDKEVNKSNLLAELQPEPKIGNKITAWHMLTDIDTEREVSSMISLTQLEKWGITYTPLVNKRWTELPPADTCEYPDKISMEPGGKLTPGHYGCYLAHKGAFYKGMQSGSEFILIFECDCVIHTSTEEFIELVEFACDLLQKTDLSFFSFGYHNNTNIVEKRDLYWVVNKFYGAHAYLIPKKSYPIFHKLYTEQKWNVADLLFAEKLDHLKIGIFPEPPTKQAGGWSILDKVQHEDRF
jgi:hypothetical protein